jgi:hypothetical protein
MEHLAEITAAAELGRSGDRDTARAQLQALWDQTDDRQTQCVIAHFLADVQNTTADELGWDLRALECADPEDPMTPGMLASLHLGLSDDYRRLGQTEQAHEHLELAKANQDALGPDAYGDLVRGALEHVTDALAAGSTAPLETNPSS